MEVVLETNGFALPETMYYAPCVILGTLLVFTALQHLISSKLTPACVKSSWKFKNITMSLLHALITGLLSFYCLMSFPEMAEDVTDTYNTSAYTLVCFSVGYFIYDSLDMLVYQRGQESFELLLHHAVILFCFSITLVTRQYVGYAIVALIAEINSVFLHTRQLMMICRVNKSATVYRVNCVANIVSYITFRILTFAWMTTWLFTNREAIPLALYTIGSIGLAIVTVMNIVLLYRLTKADFLATPKSTESNPQNSRQTEHLKRG